MTPGTALAMISAITAIWRKKTIFLDNIVQRKTKLSSNTHNEDKPVYALDNIVQPETNLSISPIMMDNIVHQETFLSRRYVVFACWYTCLLFVMSYPAANLFSSLNITTGVFNYDY